MLGAVLAHFQTMYHVHMVKVKVFNVHIQSKLLRTPVPAGEGVRGGAPALADQGSTSSPTGIGSRRRAFWNLECPVGLSQKRNMCAFQ